MQVHQARMAHGGERTLRRAKRYHVSDSPLTAIPWWRFMLDEAQNVGDGFSQVSYCSFLRAMLSCASAWLVAQRSLRFELLYGRERPQYTATGSWVQGNLPVNYELSCNQLQTWQIWADWGHVGEGASKSKVGGDGDANRARRAGRPGRPVASAATRPLCRAPALAGLHRQAIPAGSAVLPQPPVPQEA